MSARSELAWIGALSKLWLFSSSTSNLSLCFPASLCCSVVSCCYMLLCCFQQSLNLGSPAVSMRLVLVSSVLGLFT
ncbi:conserved hypothetical protein [Ricinus communis]|uniref:Uncharacterized protein n=1 Tax=Ricinus communis TaxID=3988 RepID=B9T064_RICCO|nr:conserved hypothetical protein [Ricinus communis]